MSTLFRCRRCLDAGRRPPTLAIVDDSGDVYVRTSRLPSPRAFEGWQEARKEKSAGSVIPALRDLLEQGEIVLPLGEVRPIETIVREDPTGVNVYIDGVSLTVGFVERFAPAGPNSRLVMVKLGEGDYPKRRLISCPCGQRVQVTQKMFHRMISKRPGAEEYYLPEATNRGNHRGNHLAA
jgi:hypothetical protein